MTLCCMRRSATACPATSAPRSSTPPSSGCPMSSPSRRGSSAEWSAWPSHLGVHPPAGTYASPTRTRQLRRRAVTAAVAAACALAFGVTGAVSSAADTGDQKRAVDQQIQDIQGALDETSADLANAYNAPPDDPAQLPAAQAALTQAEDAERAANQHNDEIAAQLAVAQANEQRASRRRTANKAKLDQTQSVLDNFAADLFQGGGGGSQMSVALGATSADDFATRSSSPTRSPRSPTTRSRSSRTPAPRPRRRSPTSRRSRPRSPSLSTRPRTRWLRPRPPAPRRPRRRPTSTTS